MSSLDSKRTALDAVLSRLDICCSAQQKDLLLKHLSLVVEKNKVLNLTRIDSFEDALVLHIEDSLSVIKEFEHTDGMFCDVGTGGGFPGIPLGVVSGRKGVLLDSVKKKASAVQSFIESMDIANQLECFGCRSEEYASSNPNMFETVVARAVASLNVVEELATPLLKMHGRLVAMRGTVSSQDLETAMKAAEVLGLELISTREFSIGNEEFSRSVYVFERVKEASIKLPRRAGMATKRPLGTKQRA